MWKVLMEKGFAVFTASVMKTEDFSMKYSNRKSPVKNMLLYRKFSHITFSDYVTMKFYSLETYRVADLVLGKP